VTTQTPFTISPVPPRILANRSHNVLLRAITIPPFNLNPSHCMPAKTRRKRQKTKRHPISAK
jgi:hypothetical protein